MCVKVISALTGEEEEGESRSGMHHQEASRRTNSEIDGDDDYEDEYNETKYLNDMDRHKQIAFDFQNQ